MQNRSTFDVNEFGMINLIPNLDPSLKFYQMGEEGNAHDAYEIQATRNMKRLIFRDFTISTKYPNNVVLVEDANIGTSATVCVVTDIRLDEVSDSFRVTVSPFHKQGDFYQGFPCNSSDFHIYLVTGGINTTKKCEINANSIKTQFVCLLFERSVTVADFQVGGGAAHLNKSKLSWVCIPLLHGFEN